MSKMFGKTVILAPRSGLIPEDYKRSRFMRRLITHTIRKVDYVICQGEHWKDFYQGISDSKDEKFVVIQNWLNAEPYFNIQPRSLKPDEPLNILYLAWVNQQKGIFDFIDAAKAVLAQHKNVRFWVCGEGVGSETARAKVEEYGIQDYVDFKGWVVREQKMTILKRSTLPSRRYQSSPRCTRNPHHQPRNETNHRPSSPRNHPKQQYHRCSFKEIRLYFCSLR